MGSTELNIKPASFHIKPFTLLRISPLLFPGLFIACLFAGCANFKEINSFALTSQAVMEENQNPSYGYYTYSFDSSYIYHPDPKQLMDVDCHCEAEKKLDTINSKECKVLSTYFGMLARFADPKSRITVEPVSASIQSGQYGNLTISGEEASIVNGLSIGLSALLTTNYKSNQIKKFITLYHDSVAPLIGFLEIRTEDLSAKIVNMQMTLQEQTELMIHFSERKDVKWAIIIAYEQKKDELNKILIKYQHRQLLFEQVKKGGDLIYKNVNDLKSQPFKQQLTTAIADLILIANFNK